MLTVTALYQYPLKSGAGNAAERVSVAPYGIVQDRQFMLIKAADSRMVTARTHPQLQGVRVSQDVDSVTFHSAMQPPLRVQRAQFVRGIRQTAVWNDAFSALSVDEEADRWFSQLLKEPVTLVFNGEAPRRHGGDTQAALSLADAAPLLLLSEASLAFLNARSPARHTLQQFRPNIVVRGSLPFAEDGWKTLRIGDVTFAVSAPCSRCVLTTIDPQTQQMKLDNEPLTTLSQFRREARTGAIHFGVYLTPLSAGEIACADPVDIVATQAPYPYVNRLPETIALICDAVEPICRDFTTFWFKRADGLPLPPYLAGQHLPVTVTIGQRRYQRCYTLSSSPTRGDRWSIGVKRTPSGTVSNWLHRHMRVGQSLCAAAPEGAFFLDRRPAGPIALISAGSGITPAISMLRMLADRQWIDDVIFYAQCQTPQDRAFADELQQLQQAHPSLTVITAVSHPDSEWQGVSGRFDAARAALFPALAQRHVYVCGPAGFMAQVQTLLLAAGLPADQWHQERFGEVVRSANHAYRSVQIRINGNAFSGNNQASVLEQAEKAGVSMACSCRAGVCGKCKVRLNAGSVEQPQRTALSVDEENAGYILACCAIPQDDIVIGE
ncbi:MOSC N-terminal beta barrel domain-containing protein [Edwardsiella piscicida]|uniref:MOSC N-terminal beta barrel domain-containing protein n=1 Tax=Edwardsiella piscicida TaxID=1263550 RepID=UPI000D512704|nr:MOSC N-terminal beta barrel domain-containing protein [Edwardsiella piscicida]UCQ25617.1 MOSC domain-containing protein [Edwardsiella piscicida]